MGNPSPKGHERLTTTPLANLAAKAELTTSTTTAATCAPLATNSILHDPNAFVAALALIFSIFVTFLNWLFFKWNLREERTYKRDYALYELLVLPGCAELLKFTHLAHRQLDELMRPCAKGQTTRQHVEMSVEALDIANKNLEAEVVVVMAGFSGELRDRISAIIDEYHDGMAKLFSDFDRKSIGAEFVAKQSSQFGKMTGKFVDQAFSEIKRHCPIEK
jgi:hypothetical protein